MLIGNLSSSLTLLSATSLRFVQTAASPRGQHWTLPARTWPPHLSMPLSTPALGRTSWSQCHLRQQAQTQVGVVQ